jgi:hypothetical protein
MEKDATYALNAAIYVWIQDNSHLVALAQNLAQKCLDLGLCDTNMHNPFQIVPTDIFAENGNLHHELFLNIDHAAYGYFKLIIKSDSEFQLISPKLSVYGDKIFLNIHEVKDFIDNLSSSLDDIYELDECLLNEDFNGANSIIDNMLDVYRNNIEEDLSEIREYISSYPGDVYISATNDSSAQELIKEFKQDHNLALLHPENWLVKNYSGPLSESLAQEQLHDEIYKFFKKENFYASKLYLAQKLVKESGLSINVDGEEVLYDDKMKLTLVRPIINATGIEINA